MTTVAKPKGREDRNIVYDQEGSEAAKQDSPFYFQTARLFPEIRIDTSRLDGLLSDFQLRLSALEVSFVKVAEAAAEAAHKVVIASPRNTAPSPPSPSRSTASVQRPKSAGPRLEEPMAPMLSPTVEPPAPDREKSSPIGEKKSVDPDQAVQEEPTPSLAESSIAETAATQEVASLSISSSSVQRQVEALWDAIKWMEDRMEVIDKERRGELLEASRIAAKNSAKAEVANMERERLKLALQDRPLRSELKSLNDLHEGRLKTTEVELRQCTAELSNRLQESLHKKIDQLYEDTSSWKVRLDGAIQIVDKRVRCLDHELEEDILHELEDSVNPNKSQNLSAEEKAARLLGRSVSEPWSDWDPHDPSSERPTQSRGQRSMLMKKVRSKRESGFQKLGTSLSEVRRQETEILNGMASVRAGLADLLLRVEEGELQQDQFVREMDDRVCESGQEVEVSMSRLKEELLEEIASTQAYLEGLEQQQESAVAQEIVHEVVREKEAIRDVADKTSSLEASLSALSANFKVAEEKGNKVEEILTQELREGARQTIAKVQENANVQLKANEEMKESMHKINANKADEGSLQELRNELTQSLRMMENAIAAGQKEARDLLRTEVEMVLGKVLDAESIAEAVRTDLSPEMATLGASVESMYADLKRALEENRRLLDSQDAKVAVFAGESREACSSVRSDVHHMLVCLVTSSRRRDLENEDSSKEKATIADVATVVQEQQQRREESARRMEKANIGLTILVRKMERGIHVLSSRDMFWESTSAKLRAHAEAFGDASCRVETASEKKDRFILTTELQQFVAGNTQRVAKLISQQADFEAIQRLMVVTKIEKGDLDWDRRLQTVREKYRECFLADARHYLDKKYPTHGPFCAQNRGRFFVKVEQGLKVAMSRYRSVDVGNTLFGKVKLDPACIACDRPFGPACQTTPGDARAIPKDALPPARVVKDAMSGHPRQTTTLSMDTTRTTEVFLDPAVRQHKNATKFVYRGGFKIPRVLSPMSSVDSFGASAAVGTTMWGDHGGVTSIASVSGNGESRYPVAPAFELESFRDGAKDAGGDGMTQKELDSGRRGYPSVKLGLENIIRSSRIRVRSASERGGTAAGRGEGIGGVQASRRTGGGATRRRPWTAGATARRKGSTSTSSVREVICLPDSLRGEGSQPSSEVEVDSTVFGGDGSSPINMGREYPLDATGEGFPEIL